MMYELRQLPLCLPQTYDHHSKALSALSQKSATVAENGDSCRTFLRQSPFSATVAVDRRPGASKGTLGDAKCVTEILGGQNKEVTGGTKLTFLF